jgi:hypothetical protein
MLMFCLYTHTQVDILIILNQIGADLNAQFKIVRKGKNALSEKEKLKMKAEGTAVVLDTETEGACGNFYLFVYKFEYNYNIDAIDMEIEGSMCMKL